MDDKTFKKSDWIGQGKEWATTPSLVRKAAKANLEIPQQIEYELLPAWSMPITEFLQYPLPLQMATISASPVSSFFSNEAAGAVTKDILLRIRHLAIPDTKLVRKLGAGKQQAWLDGAQSVQYVHLAPGAVVTRFPLWLITYWNDVLDIKLNVHQHWTKSQAWLTQQMKRKKGGKGSAERQQLAEDASILLGMTPWGMAKPSDSEAFHSLWRLLGPNWLTGAQLNDMLDMLQFKVNTTLALVKEFRVRSTDLTLAVLQAYDARNNENYQEAQRFDWLHVLAEDLIGNSVLLITAAHLGPVTVMS
jgi:hypothetical protein